MATFIGVGADAATTTDASVSVAAPAGYLPGDLLVLDVRVTFANSDSGDPGGVLPLTPSGWTLLQQTSDQQTSASGYSRVVLSMFTRVATGSDFPVTVSRNHAPNNDSYGLAASARAYRNVGPLVGASSQGQGSLGVRYNPAATLTVPADGILILTLVRVS